MLKNHPKIKNFGIAERENLCIVLLIYSNKFLFFAKMIIDTTILLNLFFAIAKGCLL